MYCDYNYKYCSYLDDLKYIKEILLVICIHKLDKIIQFSSIIQLISFQQYKN